jgi:SulP family sulfate permease
VVVNFLSMPVLSGYTSAVVLLVVMTQIGPLLGFHLETASQGWLTIRDLFASLPLTHYPTLICGLIFCALLFGASAVLVSI